MSLCHKYLPADDQAIGINQPSCPLSMNTALCAWTWQISVGDAGYMALPPLPPEDDPPLNHIDDGSHGVDFVLNLQDPNIAFGTVQLCTGPTQCMALSGNAASKILPGLFLQALWNTRMEAQGTPRVALRSARGMLCMRVCMQPAATASCHV